MKKYLIASVLVLLVVFAKAQNTPISAPSDTAIFSVTQITASFPGGIKEFTNYLAGNIVYPPGAKMANQQGKVFLTFIVEKDGSLSRIRVLRGVSPDIDAEAVRVIQASPKWLCAQQNGVPVRQQYTVPISFMLSKP